MSKQLRQAMVSSPIYIDGYGQASAMNARGEGQLTYSAALGSYTGRLHPEAEHQLASLLASSSRWQSADRSVLLALLASEEALGQAAWQAQEGFAILVGCSRGPTAAWEEAHRHFQEGEPLRPQTSPLTTLGSMGFALAAAYRQKGWVSSQSVTCSSGLHALVQAVAFLRSGMEERVLVGGAEAPITPFTIAQMTALRLLAEADSSQPMGQTSHGMALGEGAAFCCLTTQASEQLRPQLLGIGYAQEAAGSLSGISPAGEGLYMAMRMAIEQAQTIPDLIIPHAPGTRQGDRAEQAAMERLFPAERPAIYTAKWLTGHTFGASGSLGLDVALRLLGGRACPPLPYPLRSGWEAWDRAVRPRTVLVNATGFGGNAVSVLVGWGADGDTAASGD